MSSFGTRGRVLFLLEFYLFLLGARVLQVRIAIQLLQKRLHEKLYRLD